MPTNLVRHIGARFNEAEAIKPRILRFCPKILSRNHSFNEAEAIKPRIPWTRLRGGMMTGGSFNEAEAIKPRIQLKWVIQRA